MRSFGPNDPVRLLGLVACLSVVTAGAIASHDQTSVGSTETQFVYQRVGLTPSGLLLADEARKVVTDASKIAKKDKEKFVREICKVLIENVELEVVSRTDDMDTRFVEKDARLGAGLAVLTMGPSMQGATGVDRDLALLAARATWVYARFIRPGKYTDSIEARSIQGILDSRRLGKSEYRDPDHWRVDHVREAMAAMDDPNHGGLDPSMENEASSMIRSSFPTQVASMQSPAKTPAGTEVKKLVIDALGTLAKIE